MHGNPLTRDGLKQTKVAAHSEHLAAFSLSACCCSGSDTATASEGTCSGADLQWCLWALAARSFVKKEPIKYVFLE